MSAHKALKKRLSVIADNLTSLIEESEDPKEEMDLVARMLGDAGLSDYRAGPKTSPRMFAETVIAENPLMYETVQDMRIVLRLKAIETPEQLINRLLPANHD